MTSFTGVRALVTGGASGIGAAVVAMLRAAGAAVVVLDRTAPDPAGEAGFDADGFVRADLVDDDQVRAAVDETGRRLGGLDILINNAGIGAVGDITEATEEEWFSVWNVNVVGLARVTRAALPYLTESSCAAIVNTASIVASVGVPKRAVYSATKGAVVSLTYAMAADLMDRGIRVNAVAPGTADTPWVGRLLAQADDPGAARAALEDRQPIGRLVSADEVALAIVNLADPRAASTTGSVVFVDGGMDRLRLPVRR